MSAGGLADVAQIVIEHLSKPEDAPRALYLSFGGYVNVPDRGEYFAPPVQMETPVIDVFVVKKDGREALATRLADGTGKCVIMFTLDQVEMCLRLVQTSVLNRAEASTTAHSYWMALKPIQAPDTSFAIYELQRTAKWYESDALKNAVEMARMAFSPILRDALPSPGASMPGVF